MKQSIPMSEYDRRLSQDDRWQKVSWCMKWLAGFKCCLCKSRDNLFVLETHHSGGDYSVAGRERPDDMCVLCSLCHAEYEFRKKYRSEMVAMFCDRADRASRVRVQLEDVAKFYKSKANEFDAWLEEMESFASHFRDVSQQIEDFSQAEPNRRQWIGALAGATASVWLAPSSLLQPKPRLFTEVCAEVLSRPHGNSAAALREITAAAIAYQSAI